MADIKEQLKNDRSILEQVLTHYGVVINSNSSGNHDCIGTRHKNSGKNDLTIGKKNGWVVACNCGLKGDVYKVVEELEGIKDFPGQLDKVKKICSITDTYIPIKESASNRPAEKKSYDFTSIAEDLHKNVVNTTYFKERGLSENIIEKYKLGYHIGGLNYIIGKYPGILSEKNNDLHSQYRFFISCYDENGVCYNILSRRLDSLDPPVWVKGKIHKNHNLKGYAAALLNIRYLYYPDLTEKYYFVVEGWADALSLEELGYKSISINSTSNVKIFLNHVKKNKDLLKNKIFITVGDKDPAG